ncbi:MAG: hypothetical protein ACI8TX_000805 [Hyphomicrobiaceae bacterium]
MLNLLLDLTFTLNEPKPGNWKFGLAAMLFGLVFALALIETIPRLVPGLMPAKLRSVLRLYDARSSWENMMRGDKELGFVVRPNLELKFPSEGRTIDVNTVALTDDDIGFRDIGVRAPVDGIVVGDSFTFCDDTTVEACWVRQLGDKTGMKFASLGVNGYSNLAAARMLKNVGLKLKPKVILATFFANDFKDNLHFHNWTESGTDDYWQWMRRKRRSDTSEFFAEKSILYRLFDSARRYGARTIFEYKENDLDFVFRSDGWWRTVLGQPGATPGYKLTEEAIQEFRLLTARDGMQFVMVLIPFKEQVYWDIARQFDPDGERLETTDIDAPMNAVRTYLEKRGIAYCDLTGPMREAAAKGPQLYLRISAHWTDYGNGMAADMVADCLRDMGLADAAPDQQ